MTERAETRENRRRPRRRGEIGGGWSPSVMSSQVDREEHEWWREREITLIERALQDRGEMRRRDLGNLIGCKYWGPGRFRGALKDAVEQGRNERAGCGRYAPAALRR